MDDDAPSKRVSDFFSWRRNWGRPPRIILYGEWLYRGTVGVMIVGAGIACCYAACAAQPHEFRTVWGEWSFRFFASVLGLGIITIGYGAFLHKVWRTQLYFTSFDVNEKVQAEFDRQWDNDDYTTSPPGVGGNASFGSHEYDLAVISCRMALEHLYRVRALDESKLAKTQEVLSEIGSSPVANPVAHAAFHVSDGQRQVTLCIVGCGAYTLSATGHVTRRSVTQVVLFQIGPNLGRFWIRPETLTDKLGELFVPKEMDPMESPRFSDRFYFRAERPARITQFVPSQFYDVVIKSRDLIVVGSETHVMAARDA